MSLSSVGKVLLVALLVMSYFTARNYHAAPPPLSANADPSVYSAGRAFSHVLAMCDQPHPAGSPQAALVRDYIADQIRQLGLEPEIQEAMIYQPPGNAATVQNVLARIPGAATRGDAVALMAHYDSVVFGPGAADDGSGVAAMLEAMRLFTLGPRHFNDIIFIFTDGEEGRLQGATGLRGAHAFVEHHPWFADVRVVINFDARGVRGPSYMYQTSGKNAWLIRELARSGARASATSMMYEIYDAMPVGSDLTAFIKTGVPGYDCAFVHGLEKYHSMLDAPEHLSLASLQHNGEYAFTLASHLANQPLEKAASAKADVVYFDIVGHTIVHYSIGIARALALLLAALFLALVAFGLGCGEITPSAYSRAFLAFSAWLALWLVVGVMAMLIGYRARGAYILYSSDELTLGLALLCAGMTMPFFNRIMDRRGTYNTLFAFLTPWLILLVASAIRYPGATYLFFWSLLFALLPVGFGLTQRYTYGKTGAGAAILLALGAAPAVFFMVGAVTGLYAALLFIFVFLHLALLLLTLALLTPHIRLLTATHRYALSGILLALGSGFLLSGIFWPGFSAEQPKFNSIAYALNADSGEAFYLSCDDAPDVWTAQFFGSEPTKGSITEFIPIATREYLKAPAPKLPLAPPTLEMTEDETDNGRRTLTFTVHSPRNAEVIEVHAEPGTQVLSATVNGTPMTLTEQPWRLFYSIYRGDGIELVLDVAEDSPAVFRVADHKYYLEDLLDFQPRPPQFVPKPNTVDFNQDPLKSEESIVVKTYSL